MPTEFISRAERIVDAILESDPHAAMWAGDHRYDGQLPDLSASAVSTQVSMLREASHVLSEIDLDTLDQSDQVDTEILTNLVTARMFTLDEVREHEWNPLLHNPGALLNALLMRPTGTPEERLIALESRLRAIPDAMSSAKNQLRRIPAIHAETAAAQFRGTAALISTQTPVLLSQEPRLSSRIEPLVVEAVAALESFAQWLSGLPDGRDPRLGKSIWEAKLWLTLDTPLSASELLKRAWNRVDEITEEMTRLAVELVGGEPNRDTIVKALTQLALDRPNNDNIVSVANESMAEASAFVAEHDLVSLVDDPLEIVTMPEFARGVAAAYCDPPGTLESATVPTFYAISPTPSNWDESRVDSFFAEYNNHMLRTLTVHEAMPGHYLQLAHARRYRGRTRVRALSFSSTFVEGWAVYTEELMANMGFGGPAVKMQQLKMQLRACINAILDQQVHGHGMSESEAMDLMMVRGFQSEGEAAGKWRRALLSSTQLSTYFVGYTEVSDIASANRGSGVKSWHDKMLSFGNPPPRHIRTLMGF